MPRFVIDPDIANARTPDTGFYTDPEIFEATKEKLFARSWQFIGDTDLVNLPGTDLAAKTARAAQTYPLILLGNFLDEPLVLVNDKEDKLHLLSNVCTHRGNILVGEPCQTNHLRCRYHGRVFALDGKMQSMPEFKEVKDFPSAADDLKSLPLFQWGKWLFTTLDQSKPDRRDPDRPAPDRASTDPFFADMIKRLDWLPLQDYVFQPGLSRDFTVKAHWALYCENYLEGFHIPFVHPALNGIIDFGNYTTELFRYSNLQLGLAKDGEDCFDLPPGSPDYGKNVAAYYFFVFPNLMFNFYPWGLSLNIVKPIGLAETMISFLTYIADGSKYNKGAGSGLDEVEAEDEDVVEAVQKGIRSRFYRHGRYSVTREQGTHHFHRIMAERFA
jgi:choline monooxygenase